MSKFNIRATFLFSFLSFQLANAADIGVLAYTHDSLKQQSANLLTRITEVNNLIPNLTGYEDDLLKISANVSILNGIGGALSATILNIESWANLVLHNGDSVQISTLASSIQSDINSYRTNILTINNDNYAKITSVVTSEPFYTEFYAIILNNLVTNSALDAAKAANATLACTSAQALTSKVNSQLSYYTEMTRQINDEITRLKQLIGLNCGIITSNLTKISQYVS